MEHSDARVSGSKSIEAVQAAESHANITLENAKKERERRLHEAEEKARKIIEDAELVSNAMTEEALKKADAELAHLHKKAIEKAQKEAIKLKRTKLGNNKREKLADQAVKEIIGA